MTHKIYTPITHKEAWDNVSEYTLATRVDGEQVVFHRDMSDAEVAAEILSVPQWYKIETLKTVGLEEAYHVLERGGRVSHIQAGDSVHLESGVMRWYTTGYPVTVCPGYLSGWVVQDEWDLTKKSVP